MRMSRIQLGHSYDEIISVENLLEAWKAFKRGKTKKQGVQQFQFRLMEHILSLHTDLRNKTYRHGPYKHFRIADPKPRDIHKASVRDRLLHHAVYRVLCPLFDKKFIYDSYSCRVGKGTHKALYRFHDFAKRASFSHTKTCYILKCDIRKFFASVDHEVLFSILARHISDEWMAWLLVEVVGSFSSGVDGKGLPLGNLTSQLLVNIYMNEFDQFVKHALKAKYYIRYADDFALLSHDKTQLEQWLIHIRKFLQERLKLSLHPDKVFIKTLASGVDFLGWVHFPTHRVLRTSTKRRMFKYVCKRNLGSYLGLCGHGNTHKLQAAITRIAEQSSE